MGKLENNRIRRLVGEFSETTSAHGISNIASSTSRFWRLLWMLGTVTCLGMVLYQGIILLQTFLRKPVKSDIDVTYSRIVTFPTVTICNLNIIRKSKLTQFDDVLQVISSFDKFVKQPQNNNNNNNNNNNKSSQQQGWRRRRSEPADSESSSFGPPDRRKNALKKGITGDSSGAEERVSLSNVTFDTQAYAQEEMLSKLGNRNDTQLKHAGHTFEELVYRCTWNGFSCNVGDFKKYWRSTWNWRYGNCFIFNSGMTETGKRATVLTSAKPGPSYGVTLDLFINQHEYIGALSQEAGVRVLLKDQRNIPFPVTEGFTAAPGSSTSVGIRKLVIKRVDPFKNNSCWKKEGLEDWSIYKRYKGYKYSVQGCMYSCLARAQMDACNCTQGKFRFGRAVCTTDDQIECVMEVVEKYENHDLDCIAKCPQPCEHLSFRTTISTSTWAENYEKQVQNIMKKQGDKNQDQFVNDRDMLRSNFLRVKIYFDELNLEKITYSEYYAIENLLSDVGGQMGLWIGISVLTLAEFLKLLVDISTYLMSRKCRNAGKGEVQDIDLTEQN